MSSAKSPQVVGARYDQVAPVYGLLEWLQGFPLLGVRRKSVEALRLQPGDVVLEMGCGDGRNFEYMQKWIGPSGFILGVDASPGMLARARRSVHRRGWTNVAVTHGDAKTFQPDRPVQAVLFCLSYCNMHDRLQILERIWNLLEPGGRLVLSDIALSAGLGRRLLMGPAKWICEHTLFGDAEVDLARDLAAVAGKIEQRTIAMIPGLVQFRICTAVK